jgi:hypothetical protein
MVPANTEEVNGVFPELFLSFVVPAEGGGYLYLDGK